MTDEQKKLLSQIAALEQAHAELTRDPATVSVDTLCAWLTEKDGTLTGLAEMTSEQDVERAVLILAHWYQMQKAHERFKRLTEQSE